MSAHPLLPVFSWFSSMVSFRYVLAFLNFFCFCFMSNKCFLILLNFVRYLFSIRTILLLMRNIQNECSERATRGVLQENVFMEVPQNSPVQRLFFNKVLSKKGLWYRCFPGNFVKFLRTTFYRTHLNDCF